MKLEADVKSTIYEQEQSFWRNSAQFLPNKFYEQIFGWLKSKVEDVFQRGTEPEIRNCEANF